MFRTPLFICILFFTVVPQKLLAQNDAQPDSSSVVLDEYKHHAELIGELRPFAGVDNERTRRRLFSKGWLFASGCEVEEIDFEALFFVIQGKYGQSAVGLFNLPDMRGRVPVGAKRSGSNTLGDTMGAESFSLSELGLAKRDRSCGGGGCQYVAPMASLELEQTLMQPSLVIHYLVYFGKTNLEYNDLPTACKTN